jgi:hypothetical protein
VSSEALDESRNTASLDTTISRIENDLAFHVIRAEIRRRSIRVQRLDVVLGDVIPKDTPKFVGALSLRLQIIDYARVSKG